MHLLVPGAYRLPSLQTASQRRLLDGNRHRRSMHPDSPVNTASIRPHLCGISPLNGNAPPIAQTPSSVPTFDGATPKSPPLSELSQCPRAQQTHCKTQVNASPPDSHTPQQSQGVQSRRLAGRTCNSHTQRSRRRATSLISLSFRHSCLSSSICRPMTFSFSSVFWAGRSAVVPPLSRKGRWGKAPCLSPGTRRAVGRLSFLLSFLGESPSDCWLCFLRVSYSELRPRGPCPARLAERRRTRMPLAASPRPRAVRRA